MIYLLVFPNNIWGSYSLKVSHSHLKRELKRHKYAGSQRKSLVLPFCHSVAIRQPYNLFRKPSIANRPFTLGRKNVPPEQKRYIMEILPTMCLLLNQMLTILSDISAKPGHFINFKVPSPAMPIDFLVLMWRE